MDFTSALEFGQKLMEYDGPHDIFKYVGLAVILASVIIKATPTKKDDEILSVWGEKLEQLFNLLERLAIPKRRKSKDGL